MKLKYKAVVVVCISAILLATLFLSILRPVLLKESIDLDRENAIGEANRINGSIQSTLNDLGKLNRDWSNWDDTYNFMNDQNPLYTKLNLGQETLKNLEVDFILYLNNQNKPVLQIGYDMEKDKLVALQNDFFQEFIDPIGKRKSISEALVVKSKNGFSLASYESIYKSNGGGPSVGTLIIGKYINEWMIHSIGEELFVEMAFHEVTNTAKPQKQFNMEAINEHQMKGTILLKDYSKQHLMEISFTTDRNFYIEKKETVNNIVISLFLAGIIFVFLTIFLLNRFIINRISNLSEQLHYIQLEGNMNNRIKRTKNQYDEISKLEYSINQMLTSLESKHNEVIQLALYDHLTGLPNRYAFYKEFERRTMASPDELIVLFFDLDGFKQVNDTFGHEIGDKLLKEISQRVRRISEAKNGYITRYGGDEFLILFDHMNLQELEAVVQAILEVIGREYNFADFSTLVTASIGISIYPRDGTTIEQVLKNADYAMYEAKNKGKNQYVFFHEISNE
ncbi:diguanylate cyclase (GGDEF) domain-containing protein [Psychrobacillus sp. OK028]|uniref:sensor domain-containing diguanylate cyclase n=1 Tax=Psychrobacillus sp. OK028 TaxID=1884359 RepID=UPI00087FCDE3|nr:diguanylate cyclase [Psychrobacillus sp. OK028]SDN79953.1 diguanylate cyclase (GGDEF) domain-containing protein [Psychrobacillus sp. OK028]